MLLLAPLNLSMFSHLPPPIEEKNVHHFHASALCCLVLHLSALLKQAIKSERILGVKGKTERGADGRQEQIVRTEAIEKALLYLQA